MATEIRRPTADSTPLQCTTSSGSDHFALVNEEVAADGGYVENLANGTQATDIFTLASSGLAEGTTINAVTVFIRGARPGAAAIYAELKIGATTYQSVDPVDIAAGGAFALASYTWNTNPATSGAWTLSAYQALKAGSTLGMGEEPPYSAKVSQVYLSGDYTAVPNVAPSCSLSTVTKSGNNLTATVTPTASDSDGVVTDITITWGDGNTTAACTSGQAYEHTYAAHGTYSVKATATDDDAATTDSETREAAMLNVAPTCSLSTVTNLANNLTAKITPTASDTDGTIASLVIAWGDTQTTTGCTSGVEYEHTYAAHGTYSITATATDDDGASTESSARSAVMLNTAPSATLVVGGVVGNTITVSGVATDADGTIASLHIDWDDGEDENVTDSVPVEHTYANAGTYHMLLTVTDDDGATDTDTGNAVIANTAPICSFTTMEVSKYVVEVNANASSDPDGGVITAWRIKWTAGDTWHAGVVGVALQHDYGAAGSYLITVEVTDDEASTATDTDTVVLVNLPPVPTLTVDDTDGLTVTVTPSATDDGSVADLTIDWGDGSTDDTGCADGVPVEHTYAAGGLYTITLTATDDEAATADDTAEVDVVGGAALVSMQATAVAIGMGMG